MSDKQRVRLLGPGINKVIEVPKGTESVEHEGRFFQRTGLGHSVGPDHPIPSFHVVEDNE